MARSTADALYADLIQPARTVGTTAATTSTTAMSIGQLLDLYLVHWIMTIIFIIGGIFLIERYANYAGKPFTAWDDLFYASGALGLVLNAAFVIALPIVWLTREMKFLSREDASIHWLHALSIFAGCWAIGWGILALVLTFSSALTATTTDDFEVAGYFMVIIAVAYELFLVIRSLPGLKPGTSLTSVQPPITADSNAYLSIFRSTGSGAGNMGGGSAQPIFGGAGGAAAFGGLDLSAFQPSSLSTVAPTQGPSSGGYNNMGQQQGGGGCGVPIIVMPQMMQPNAACAVQDPDRVHL